VTSIRHYIDIIESAERKMPRFANGWWVLPDGRVEECPTLGSHKATAQRFLGPTVEQPVEALKEHGGIRCAVFWTPNPNSPITMNVDLASEVVTPAAKRGLMRLMLQTRDTFEGYFFEHLWTARQDNAMRDYREAIAVIRNLPLVESDQIAASHNHGEYEDWQEVQQDGDLKLRVADGDQLRVPRFLYRVMGRAEYAAAKRAGAFQPRSGERIHASSRPHLRYANSPDHVVVRFAYDDADGWRPKWGDELYAVTDEAVPFSQATVMEGREIVESAGEQYGSFHGTVYHGSDERFSEFTIEPQRGVFFSGDREYAEGYGHYLYTCRVHLDHPRVFTEYEANTVMEIDRPALISAGYDGRIVRYDDGSLDVVAFYPRQISILAVTP
jgi:hypothetical protein